MLQKMEIVRKIFAGSYIFISKYRYMKIEDVMIENENLYEKR